MYVKYYDSNIHTYITGSDNRIQGGLHLKPMLFIHSLFFHSTHVYKIYTHDIQKVCFNFHVN